MNKLILFLCFFIGTPALAYVPPVHFQVKKITEGRTPFASAKVEITVLKPAQDNHSVDEVLWKESFLYTSLSAWPVLPLLLEANETSLMAAWRNFGLLAPTEQELLANKPAQYKAMENSPRPFYRFNPQLSLKRFPGGIAYGSENPQTGRSILIERDTFLPISVSGPCPNSLRKLAWVRGNEDICRIEFERGHRYKPNASRAFRLILRNNKQSLLIFRVDSVKLNPSKEEGSARAPSSDLQNIFDGIFR